MQLLVLAPKSGVYQTVFQNHSGFKKQVPEGPCLGEEEEAEVLLIPEPGESDLDLAELLRQSRPPLQQNPGGKKKRSSFKPLSYLSCPHLMQSCSESSPTHHHNAFTLEDGERVEMDLVNMKMDTGDTSPKKQPPRQTPFWQKLAKKLKIM